MTTLNTIGEFNERVLATLGWYGPCTISTLRRAFGNGTQLAQVQSAVYRLEAEGLAQRVPGSVPTVWEVVE